MYQNLRSKTTQRKFSILIFFFPQSVCSPSLSSRAASVFTQEQSNPSQVRIVIKIVWLSYHCDNDWKLLYTKYKKHDIVISLWQLIQNCCTQSTKNMILSYHCDNWFKSTKNIILLYHCDDWFKIGVHKVQKHKVQKHKVQQHKIVLYHNDNWINIIVHQPISGDPTEPCRGLQVD